MSLRLILAALANASGFPLISTYFHDIRAKTTGSPQVTLSTREDQGKKREIISMAGREIEGQEL
jgi:hypothetical protein